MEKRHKVVWLIDTAVDGHLSITGSEDRPVLKRPASKVTPRPDEMTTAVLDRIFCGEDSVSLGSYDPNFSAAWGLLDSGLDEWRRASGLWHPAGDRRRRYALWLGVLATFTGLFFVFSGGSGIGDGGGPGTLVACALTMGAGAALWFNAWELRVRTPRGTALWLGVVAFRRFLAESGIGQADGTIDGDRLDRHTAWAVALGELDGWSKAVAASQEAPSAPSRRRRSHYDPQFVRALTRGDRRSAAPGPCDGRGRRPRTSA